MIRSLVALSILFSVQAFAKCEVYSNAAGKPFVEVSSLGGSSKFYVLVVDGKPSFATDTQTRYYDFLIEQDVTFANGHEVIFRSHSDGLIGAYDVTNEQDIDLEIAPKACGAEFVQ